MDKVKLFAALNENNVVENYTTINYSHRLIEYCDCDELCTQNAPVIGATFDETLNAFIPPKPEETYVLNEETFKWYPDTNLEYMIDDIPHKWDPITYSWYRSSEQPPDPEVFREQLKQQLLDKGRTLSEIQPHLNNFEMLQEALRLQ